MRLCMSYRGFPHITIIRENGALCVYLLLVYRMCICTWCHDPVAQGYGGKDFQKREVLSLEWKNEGVWWMMRVVSRWNQCEKCHSQDWVTQNWGDWYMRGCILCAFYLSKLQGRTGWTAYSDSFYTLAYCPTSHFRSCEAVQNMFVVIRPSLVTCPFLFKNIFITRGRRQDDRRMHLHWHSRRPMY